MNSKNREIDITSIVGKDVKITGDIKSDGGLRIDGDIKGSIVSKSIVSATKTSKIEGDITASGVIASGIIEGNITCQGTLEIKKTARIKGNISSKVLIVEPGATLNGNCIASENSGKTLGNKK